MEMVILKGRLKQNIFRKGQVQALKGLVLEIKKTKKTTKTQCVFKSKKLHNYQDFQFTIENQQSLHCLSSDISIANVRDNIVFLEFNNF